jgi:DNA invertase Pin-like site-specific DNA recombinase
MTDKHGANVVYMRVSTVDQNLARQEELRDGADKVFEEKASASTRERPQLTAMLNFVREGDAIRVWSTDRLARSLTDLTAIIDELREKKVSITFEKENMTFDAAKDADPYQRLQFHMMGAIAEFERSLSKQRQAEGIEKAKARGAYKGRKRVLTDEQVEAIDKQIKSGVTIARVARDHGVSRGTIYSELKRRNGGDS